MTQVLQRVKAPRRICDNSFLVQGRLAYGTMLFLFYRCGRKSPEQFRANANDWPLNFLGYALTILWALGESERR
jgi:hypothetical protein